VGASKPTGFEIQRRWNEHGSTRLVPRYTMGRRARLTDAQREELRKSLKENPMDMKSVRL